MRVLGRRAFPRFRTLGGWFGRLRTSKQVGINLAAPDLTVISDSPGVVDVEVELALLRGDDQLDVKVRVVATCPQVVNGVLRHQLELEVLDAPGVATGMRVWGR